MVAESPGAFEATLVFFIVLGAIALGAHHFLVHKCLSSAFFSASFALSSAFFALCSAFCFYNSSFFLFPALFSLSPQFFFSTPPVQVGLPHILN